MAAEPSVGPPEHPTDHAPFWLFLRQERREEDLIVDVFHCARCLGRVEVIAAGTPAGWPPGEIGTRPRGPLRTLGSAAREG